MKATIWHNPKCGTSRKTLAILENQRPPAIVTKEQNVAFGCAVLRIFMPTANNVSIQLQGVDFSMWQHLADNLKHPIAH